MFQRAFNVNLKSHIAWEEVMSIQKEDFGEVQIAQTYFMLAKIMSLACKNNLIFMIYRGMNPPKDNPSGEC
jgi:hypothetical protein